MKEISSVFNEVKFPVYGSENAPNYIRPTPIVLFIRFLLIQLSVCYNGRYRQISSNGVYGEGITIHTAHLHELFCVSAIQTHS